jgi:catechol 2,3-dioxygenase-like lactoylglutathione lyase family enzyme
MYICIGINVPDLGESISFYTKLFGKEPVKVKVSENVYCNTKQA